MVLSCQPLHWPAGALVLFHLVSDRSVFLFRPQPTPLADAVGLSAIIGTALLINTTRSGRVPVRLETWPTFRLFVIPFCVSSFSALVVKRGFFLVFSPQPARAADGTDSDCDLLRLRRHRQNEPSIVFLASVFVWQVLPAGKSAALSRELPLAATTNIRRGEPCVRPWSFARMKGKHKV